MFFSMFCKKSLANAWSILPTLSAAQLSSIPIKLVLPALSTIRRGRLHGSGCIQYPYWSTTMASSLFSLHLQIFLSYVPKVNSAGQRPTPENRGLSKLVSLICYRDSRGFRCQQKPFTHLVRREPRIALILTCGSQFDCWMSRSRLAHGSSEQNSRASFQWDPQNLVFAVLTPISRWIRHEDTCRTWQEPRFNGGLRNRTDSVTYNHKIRKTRS